MKTIWQVRRSAVLHALGAIVLSAARLPRNKESTCRPGLQYWRSIGTLALLAGALLLTSFAAAQAQVPTTTTITSSQNPSESGQSVTFTATVSQNSGTTAPTGTVTFSDDTTSTTLGTVALATVGTVQQATVTTSSLAVIPAGHTITASYNGVPGTFATSRASLNQVVTNGIPTTVTVTSSPNPSAVNQSVTFTATVSPASGFTGSPTGSVDFKDLNTNTDFGTVTLQNVGGLQKASVTASLTPAQIHNIQVIYSGDGSFSASNVQFNQVVSSGTATTATLTSSPNPSTTGTPVTFTATIKPTSGSGTPTGNVTFQDTNGGAGQLAIVALSPLAGGGAQATFTTAGATLGAGSHNVTATYPGDATFSAAAASVTQIVGGTVGTTTTLTSSLNPSAVGQAVTFTAIVKPASGVAIPTGTVTFKDNGTAIGAGTLSSVGSVQTATFTTSNLTAGSHPITAVYGGDANFASSPSAALTQNVSGGNSDSVKLREMQVSTTPVIAAAWGATTSSAMDDAVSAGFGGDPQALSPAGTGFTYYFTDDAPAQGSAGADQDSLRRYLASPNGSPASPNGSANSAANDSVKRVDDDFRTLGYAGGMPTKAPPPSSAAPREWLAWVTVRGTDYFRGTAGDDLKGDQVDVLAGLTRRISPNFVVGAFGGYEHFDYSSQAFNGKLKGDGWTVGAYLGWKLAPNLRFDAGGAWSDIMANDTAGTANGNFTGTRWLINGGLTGTYPWQQLVFEPSARVFALWEHENAFTDNLGTFQPARNFETGRASAGVKAIYPSAWTSSTVALSPYGGLYADYYFSKDDAQTVGLTTVPLLQGFSARATGGVVASFAGGATLGAGGEFGGIGSATHIWTWTARGRIPF
jgi:hypothetical protein